MKTILIVEDVAETRQWLTGIAEAAFSGCKVTCAGRVREGLSSLSRTTYDLVLIDLTLPDGSGFDILRHIRTGCPETLSVITTIVSNDANIVAALSGGANGYLLKDQPSELIIRQLKQLADGIPALSPSIARRIMQHFSNTGPAAEPDAELTQREQQVLALISRGLRNIDVAQHLDVSESTIASHLKSIYRKLGISSRAEASWHASRMGLTPGGRTGGSKV
jgi:DNA-binding NarL/FixJ family response regulator